MCPIDQVVQSNSGRILLSQSDSPRFGTRHLLLAKDYAWDVDSSSLCLDDQHAQQSRLKQP